MGTNAVADILETSVLTGNLTSNQSLHSLSYITVQHEELESNAVPNSQLHEQIQSITHCSAANMPARPASTISAQVLYIKILLPVVLLAATLL